jgi:hypothetical protein
MTNEKLYMVGAIGYEYNDEVFYRGESESVTPVILYRSVEKAEAEAARLTLSDLRDAELSDYAWCVEDLVRDTKVHKRALEDLMEKYSPGWEISSCEGHDGLSELSSVIKQMPDADVLAFLSHLTIKFYEVHEVILAE